MPAPIRVRVYRDQPDRSRPPFWVAEAQVGRHLYRTRTPGAPVFHVARHMAKVGVPDAPLLVIRGLSGPTVNSHPSFYALSGAAPAA